MYLNKTPVSHIGVCNVLDDLGDSTIRGINWRRPVYAAIDELRATAAPVDQLDTIERISIALLKLDWAIQQGNAEKEDQAREQLAELGEAWRSFAELAPAATLATDDHEIEPHEVGSITEALERIAQRQY